MCSSCRFRENCNCSCDARDIILAAIGQPFCMVCEHQLKGNHDDKTSGVHPIPQRRAMAAGAAVFFACQGITPSPAALQPVTISEAT